MGRAVAWTCLALVLLGVGSADADDASGPSSREGWRIHLSPYAWLTGVDGTTTIDGERNDISVSFEEFLELTNSGFQLMLRARKGKWSISSDLTLADLGLEEEGQFLTLDVDLDQVILAVKGGYRVFTRSADIEPERSLPRNHGVDLEWGVRYWDFSSVVTVGFDLIPPGLPPELMIRSSDRWADAFVGATYAAPLSRKLSILAIANLGGFGFGESSRLTWEGALVFSYVTAKHWAFSGGYRALFWDRTTTDDDGVATRSELMLRGFIIGATYSF